MHIKWTKNAGISDENEYVRYPQNKPKINEPAIFEISIWIMEKQIAVVMMETDVPNSERRLCIAPLNISSSANAGISALIIKIAYHGAVSTEILPLTEAIPELLITVKFAQNARKAMEMPPIRVNHNCLNPIGFEGSDTFLPSFLPMMHEMIVGIRKAAV